MKDFNMVPLKRVAELYSGDSIKDEDKGLYEDSELAVPYIATKDIDRDTHVIDYDNGMYVKIEDTSFKRAFKGCSLVCLEGGNAGKKIGFLEQEVAFVNKLCCLRPYGLNPRFLYYVLQSGQFADSFAMRISGLIGGVSVTELGNIKIPILDNQQQQSVADYLDEATSRIDKLIDDTERSINLINQLIKSAITRVVLLGLDPSVDYSASGYSWMGNVPSSWKKSRISEVCDRSISYGIIKLGDFPEDEGVPVIRCSDVREGYLELNELRAVTTELSNEYKRTILRGGEVLINVRGTLGGCALVPETCAGYNIAREVAMIDVKQAVSSRFILYYLQSECFWDYLNANLAGSVYQGLNIELLEKAPIFLPPTKEEQDSIADYLDGLVENLRQTICLKRKEIEVLREYRRSLISEAVTGKFKVSEVN